MQRVENYLLFVPSLLSKAQTITYKVGEKKYYGQQTNEAVTKYLIEDISSRGGKLDKIIMLCSQEVLKDELEQICGQTTLEYYESEIKDFIRENKDIREKGLYAEEDLKGLFAVIPYTPKNDGTLEEITEPLMRVLQIAGEGSPQGEKHLYVDFTGGIRSSALLLLFACRILQKSGVMVEKILYSQIFPKTAEDVVKGVVEECTRTYQLFGYLEAAVEAKAGGTEKMLEYANTLNDTEKKQVENILKKQKEMEEAQRQNQVEKVKELSKEYHRELEKAQNTDASAEMKRALQTLADNGGKKAKNIFDKGQFSVLGMIENLINDEKYDEALKLFRERIVGILYQAEIFQAKGRFLDKKNKSLNEALVVKELMGVYHYYENPKSDSSGGRNTFMDAVCDYIGRLSSDTAREPEEVLREWEKDYYDLGRYLEKAPNKSFAHNDYSRKAAMKKIAPRLEQYHKDGVGMGQILERYMKLDRVYMGYGFPFACTYDGFFSDGYDKEYQKNLGNGVRSLGEFKRGKEDAVIQKMHGKYTGEDFTYETLVKKLNEETANLKEAELLHMLFPYRLLEGNLSCGKAMEKKREQWKEFMYDFVKSFYLVKDVRNKEQHAGELEDGAEERAVEEVQKVLRILANYIS